MPAEIMGRRGRGHAAAAFCALWTEAGGTLAGIRAGGLVAYVRRSVVRDADVVSVIV